MESLAEIGVFFAQALIVLFVVGGIVLIIAMAAARGRTPHSFEIEILNNKFKDYANMLKSELLSKDELKSEKKKNKEADKKEEKNHITKPRLFVLSFDGDIKASQTENLREEITAVLSVATPADEVVLRLESPGGLVHGYGLAASQLLRVREKNIPLTICVDKVAASGGYLMSCVATKILAAPFAIVGSVGVVAQVPNFHRLLKKHDVDYKEYTAGDFKRTVSVFGEITEKGERKFVEQLEETHLLFKSFVRQYRPQLDVEKIATGEYWYGQKAIELKLVDHIQTSDDYLTSLTEKAQIVQVRYEKKQSLQEKLSAAMGKAVEHALVRVATVFEKQRHI